MIRGEEQCFGNGINALGNGAPYLLPDPGSAGFPGEQGGQIPKVFF
jgi:hypothetical protein